jgi:fibronectin type 3 domain-containing protein
MKTGLPLLLVLAFTPHCLASIGITTTDIPNALVKSDYSAVIQAGGGCTPYKWQLTSGKLPNGIKMSPSDTTKSLDLSGSPNKAGTFTFTITATGCQGHVSKASYTIVVQKTADHVVDLNWKASRSRDVVGYNVYRGSDGKLWTKVNANLTASTLYSDLTVADSSMYYYATTAVDIDGNESKKSNIVIAKVP